MAWRSPAARRAHLERLLGAAAAISIVDRLAGPAVLDRGRDVVGVATALPPTDVITSPTRRPAVAAGPPAVTAATVTPPAPPLVDTPR